MSNAQATNCRIQPGRGENSELINGPRSASQPDGHAHMHGVFMANGHTDVLTSNRAKILRCIRCGACQNPCNLAI
jgi:L-lactate utilization protein LutB